MSNKILAGAFAVLLLVAAGCAPRGASSSLPDAPSATTPDSIIEASSSAVSNSAVSAVIDPLDQPDPTLPENWHGSFIMWEHWEYMTFGDPAAYQTVEIEAKDIEALNNSEKADTARLQISLPPNVSYNSETFQLEYDGHFQNGKLVIGYGPANYYPLQPGETPFDNEAYPPDYYSGNIFTGEKYNVKETKELVLGGFCTQGNFKRYISMEQPQNNFSVDYVVDLGDGHVTGVSFVVSQQATAEDMTIYDNIVKSVKLIK